MLSMYNPVFDNGYLVCLLVEFDLLFAFGVLACRILDCASLLCWLLSGKLRCLRLKLELLAFGILRKHIDMFLAGVEFHVLASRLVCFAGRLCLLR